jgi:hypothetical protein
VERTERLCEGREPSGLLLSGNGDYQPICHGSGGVLHSGLERIHSREPHFTVCYRSEARRKSLDPGVHMPLSKQGSALTHPSCRIRQDEVSKTRRSVGSWPSKLDIHSRPFSSNKVVAIEVHTFGVAEANADHGIN